MTQEELEQIEISNLAAKEDIKVGEAMQRMMDTEEYKLVIAQGYQTEYAHELGEAISKNTGGYDEKALISDLKGINGLIKYTFTVAGRHTAALQTLSDNESYMATETEE